jgi:hypothetical protein
MFEAKVDAIAPLVAKFDTLAKQIESLQEAIPQELVAWQHDDMHRKFPNIEVEGSGNEIAASTEIWPHSRLEAQEAAKAWRQSRRGPKRYRVARASPVQHSVGRAVPKQRGGREAASTRPILRDELLKKLTDRMLKVTSEAMKWP